LTKRVRQRVAVSGLAPFEIWCARPEDVIVGKLLAWAEGHSRKHESDILQMLVLHYRGAGVGLLDEAYIDEQVQLFGPQVAALWTALKQAARQETALDK
jgi:hypothetical protein